MGRYTGRYYGINYAIKREINYESRKYIYDLKSQALGTKIIIFFNIFYNMSNLLTNTQRKIRMERGNYRIGTFVCENPNLNFAGVEGIVMSS